MVIQSYNFNIMQNIFKSLIKIIYVVILPIAFIVSSYFILNKFEVSTGLLVGITLIGAALIANAVMYLVFMSKVKMLPKATIDIVPIFGFAFGVDPHDNPDKISWLLLIPFVSIEFTSKR